MAARLPWILAALALALAALGVFLWRSDAPRVEAPTSEVRAAASVPRGTELLDVAPQERERERDEPEPARAPAVAASARTAVPEPRAGPPQRLIVRGRVSGPSTGLEQVELVLRRSEQSTPSPVQAACDAAGGFEFDASALLDASAVRLQTVGLVLTLKHPDCLVERRRILVSAAATPESAPDAHYVVWRPGTTVCELDVVLTPATRVRGLVLGVDDPLGVAVVAAELREGRPHTHWAANAVPDELGRFDLPLQPHTSYVIVAAALDLRPTTVRIDLAGPGVHELVLPIDAGVELSGRLRPAPGFGADEFAVDLHFALEEGAERPELWPRPAARFDRLVWIDGAFEWRLRSQRTRGGGTFLFRGLAPREYELRAIGVGVQGEELRAWPVARLRAPAHGLTLGPALTSIDLDLGPLPDGPIAFALSDEEGGEVPRLGPYRTDARGRAQVHLPPGRAYGVLVGGEVVGRIATPGAGEFARFALAR